MLFVFKAGKAIKFIPKSIIIGFTAGAGIAAALGQIAPLMGIRLNASNFTPIAKAYYTISDISNLNVYALIPGLITILLIIVFQKINSKIPGALIGMTISTLLVIVFHFSNHNINLVGSIPLVIPKIYFFDISFSNLFLILNAGFVIALIGNIETISSLEFSANKTGEKIDVNKEILSQGLINFFSSFFQCLPSSGTLTRTAINCLNGAKTNLSNIFSGLFALLIVLLFSNYIKYLPISCLAGVIIVVAFRIVNFNEIKAIIRRKNYDTFLLMITLCIPVITGRLDYSIYCGILFFVLHKFSRNIINIFKVAK
jgi:SulP family sulfate permease